jgi:hypothetical protein
MALPKRGQCQSQTEFQFFPGEKNADFLIKFSSTNPSNFSLSSSFSKVLKCQKILSYRDPPNEFVSTDNHLPRYTCLRTRVTRLGEFSPLGRLFTLRNFVENYLSVTKCWATLFHGEGRALLLTKLCLATFWAIIFSNPSCQPVRTKANLIFINFQPTSNLTHYQGGQLRLRNVAQNVHSPAHFMSKLI